MKPLNNKDAKKELAIIEEYWGCDLKDLLSEHIILKSSKLKLYLLRRDSVKVEWPQRISQAGLYIASVKDALPRLSVEGSQLIGPRATKQIMDISTEDADQWIRGTKLPVGDEVRGCLIIRCGTDYMSCGHAKENVLTNYLPKSRRIHSSDIDNSAKVAKTTATSK
jgi:NOL1/NOP2/fmu family ribosome biogenesis protein